jgi:hypothetical protein
MINPFNEGAGREKPLSRNRPGGVDNLSISARVIQILQPATKEKSGWSLLNGAFDREPVIAKRGDVLSCPQSFPHLWITSIDRDLAVSTCPSVHPPHPRVCRNRRFSSSYLSTMMTVQHHVMKRKKILAIAAVGEGSVKDATSPHPIVRLRTRRRGECRISSSG